jgi:excisionase family DNA binding protein
VFLTYADVSALTGISVSTLYKWRERGKMPAPAVDSGHAILWTREAIDEWMRDENVSGPDRA